MTPEDFAAFMASPRWPRVVASAPTLPRECRVENDWVYAPGQFAGIDAPVLVLTGSESEPGLVECARNAAAALPGSRIRVLDGHGHFAYKTDPAMVAALVLDFLTKAPGAGQGGESAPAGTMRRR